MNLIRRSALAGHQTDSAAAAVPITVIGAITTATARLASAATTLNVPEMAATSGAVTSCAATATLTASANGLGQPRATSRRDHPGAITTSAAVADTLSVVAALANLAVAVVIAPITVIGTAAAALSVCWPAGADLLIRFTGPELWWLLSVARWASAIPGASVPVPSGLPGALTVGAAGIGVVVLSRWWRKRLSARHDTIRT